MYSSIIYNQTLTPDEAQNKNFSQFFTLYIANVNYRLQIFCNSQNIYRFLIFN
jgi:hypothetical protein